MQNKTKINDIYKAFISFSNLDLRRNEFFHKILCKLSELLDCENISIFWKGNNNIYSYSIDKKQKYSISLLKTLDSNNTNSNTITYPITVSKIKKGKIIFNRYNTSSEDQNLYKEIADILAFILNANKTKSDIRERVKELTCLYEIFKLTEKENTPFENIIEELVKLLPPAFQYPEIAFSEIVLDEKKYFNEKHQVSPFILKSDIIVNKKKKGYVKVGYQKDKFDPKSFVFLQEEQSLLDTIAKQIALLIERHDSSELKNKLQKQLMHSDRLATIGQLSAGVAHELNEPLGAILGFAQLVTKDPDLKKESKSDIQKIIRASLHTREIIKKLMLFAKQVPAKKSRVNINNVVIEDLDFLKSRCKKENIELSYNLANNIPRVVADKSQLHQVLVNLVVNSIQAIKTKGKINISTDFDEQNIYLKVSDTGTGISEDIIDKIFIPFFTTKKINEGTGIGLSVVNGIISSHSGSINVKSIKNKETLFKINIPINLKV